MSTLTSSGEAVLGLFALLTDPGEVPHMEIVGEGLDRELPLKHTHVCATVLGFVAEVEVRQTFENPSDDVIEVVYVFPFAREQRRQSHEDDPRRARHRSSDRGARGGSPGPRAREARGTHRGGGKEKGARKSKPNPAEQS